MTLPFAAKRRLEGSNSDLQRPAFLWVRMMGRLKPGVTREQAVGNLNPALQQSMLEEWQQAVAARPPNAVRDPNRTLAGCVALARGARRPGIDGLA